MPRACVVIPTRNEQDSIFGVIAEIRRGFENTRYDDLIFIIADDLSDRTRVIAAENGAYVVHGTGEGLGVAMYRGLKAAVSFEPDVIVAVDGDGQADAAEEIKRFLHPIDHNLADLVLGSRFLQAGLVHYAYRSINRMGTRVLSAFLRAQTGLDLTDSHGGIRAMVPDVAADSGDARYPDICAGDDSRRGGEGLPGHRDPQRLAPARARQVSRRRFNSEICFLYVARAPAHDRGIISVCFIPPA